MRRRAFLKLSAAGGVVASTGAFANAAAVKPAAAAVVITDISAQTDVANLIAVLDSFIANGLWVSCAVRPPGTALDGYVGILQELLALGPGVEIALDLDDLADLSPHFQARAAFEAQRRFWELAGGGEALSASTVLCADTEAPTAPIGVRSAGIRNVLVRPDARAPTRSETWPNGVVRFFGGTWLTPWSTALPQADQSNNRLYYISTKTFTDIPEAQARDWASRLAKGFFEAELAGAQTTMPVSDLQLRDDFRFVRPIVVRLLGEGPQMQDFAARLADRRIPFLREADPNVPGYWVPEPLDETSDTGLVALSEIGCGDDGHWHAAGKERLKSGVSVRIVADRQQPVGLDECAVLNLREVRVDRPVAPGDRLAAAHLPGDLIVTVTEDALSSPAETTALVSAIAALDQDGVTRFVSLDALANGILSHDPIERRHRRTRAAMVTPASSQAEPSADETAALMEDARLAWDFFEEFTDPTTGLCPATANVYTGDDALTWVTMWDVGSQINALVAAHELDLIDAPALAASARRILDQIAGRRSQDRLLPNGVIRTDRYRAGSQDFDGCDAGRLLASLDNLRRHSDLGDEIAARVTSWDLDQVVIDREIYSVQDGALISTYASHCAHYSARAFERWGFDVGSPYRTFDRRSPTDGEVALLEAVADIGPLGAEPLLLEAMELGMSAESAYLAEVLHVAQVEEYEETGTLMAVSEMPIRRAPWFIYLGLQLGREPREWGIDVVAGDEQFRTDAFLEQNMALSTKAAYLWAAYRPGAYSDALVAHVRNRARLPIGFASNVSPTENGDVAPFTDLNTNAVILQAIARMLAVDGPTEAITPR